jgi:hypothetical protein
MHILVSTSVPFTVTTVQVPNLALTYTKRITVYKNKQQLMFRFVTQALWNTPLCSSTVKFVFDVVDAVAADVDNCKAVAVAETCMITNTGFELRLAQLQL